MAEETVQNAALPGAAPAPTTVVAAATPAAAPAMAEGVVAEGGAPVVGATPLAATPAAPEPVAYDPTGNYVLDLALDFVGKAGVAQDHPAMVAALTGDFSKLREHLAGLGEKGKGYEKHMAAAEAEFKAEQGRAKERGAQTTTAVHAIMGGADNWKAVQTWAGSNAEDGEKVEINAAFQAGGLRAQAMAQYLKAQYIAKGGTFKAGDALSPNAAPKAGSTGSNALSPGEYREALGKLTAKVGATNLDSNPEYKALKQRRLAWRG